LGETERARALFELAISQLELDMPELLWKVHLQNIPVSKQKLDTTLIAWILVLFL
jgi:hypothetical protein